MIYRKPARGCFKHWLMVLLAYVLWPSLILAGPATPTATNAPPDLTPIFGAQAGDWTLADKLGKPGRYAMREWDGRPVLAIETPALVFQNPTVLGVGSEVTVRLHVGGESGALRFNMAGGLTGQTNTSEGLSLTLSARAGEETVTALFQKAGQGPREFLAQRRYELRWITQCGLKLPEEIRRQVEHQIGSLPRLHEKWIVLRWQIREDGTRVYVDDRLLWAGPLASAGRFRLELSKGMDLASFSAAPLTQARAGFEPVILDQYLNASAFLDGKLKRDSLPPTGAPLEVGGVPFVLPQSDARGNDHVDLEPSWLQGGFMGGRDAPHAGTFGGRWSGAWSKNPARLQFAIPPGRYSAIHLLAAADSEPGSLPLVTAQFYGAGTGNPVQAGPVEVQRFDAPAGDAARLPAALESGRKGSLFLVTIPVEPGSLARFGDNLELELTKGVRLYRAYPDPMFYSFHQAGLPSAAHVYALTLEQPAVCLDLQAANGLHVWTAPEKPVYKASLAADQPLPGPVTLELSTVSYDGRETTAQKKEVTLKPGREEKVAFELKLKKHGYHSIRLVLSLGGKTIQTETRSLALLHPDTRERGDWDRGKGPLFGFWNWRGGHGTPQEPTQTLVMALAGAECDHGTYSTLTNDPRRITPELAEVARHFRMRDYKAFGAGDHYMTANFATDLQKNGLAAASTNFTAEMARRYLPPDDLNQPLFLSFFPEPGIGLHTHGVPLSYDGLPETNDYVFTEAEEARFQMFHNGFLEGAKIVRKLYPDVKCLLAHGDPGFPPPFLRRSPEIRPFVDGVCVDIPLFEKLPEFQMHQVALHRLYISREEFRKAGIPNPWLPMYEGPCLPSRPGALSQADLAAQSVRSSLILLVYGVDLQTGGWIAYECAASWGEQHYGGGICDPIPLATPRPAYAAFAAMTRHLNRRNFDRWLPTGSLSTYALQFKHYKDQSLTHVFWTLRGQRPVTVAAPADARVAVYDSMDNPTDLPVKDGAVTFDIGPEPCFVTGLPSAPAITLGEPVHADAAPAANALALAALGDGTWSVSAERDMDYEDSAREFIRRYPAAMTATPVGEPDESRGPALAVHLEKPERECRTMPYYTALVPKKPVMIPGKASHLGLWVKAASDWGRVVYSLRDAKGERWLSIGTKGAWNCDDIHAWSSFNFDGWRYLRFELPACSPYDLFREAGTTWWGSYSKGDQIPDLPLTLEKILVERRTHAMYVNDPQPAATNDVRLGRLFAEYETPEDRTDRAVALSRLRMPVPPGTPNLDNPIRALEASGFGPAVAITKIEPPLHQSDGTQCDVFFTTAETAVAYDVWASPYPDGRGALKVAQGLKEPGRRIKGLRPDTDFYLFVVYTDNAKKLSKPSAAFKVNLKDTFGMK